MASLGCVGVNLHGGANGYYSPIVGSIESGFSARPEYYGLMLAQQFAGRTLQRTTLEAQGANITAYAAGRGDAQRTWWPSLTRMAAMRKLRSLRLPADSSELRSSVLRHQPSTPSMESRFREAW